MSNCQSCSGKSLDRIPYIAHESAMARYERTVKRLIIAVVSIVVLWFATIGLFVWYMNQYEYQNYDVELKTDGGGDANYVGRDGGVYDGSSPS